MNTSDCNSDKMDMNADAREELNADAPQGWDRVGTSFSDDIAEYFDDEDFDPSGGYTEDDFPVVENDDYDYNDGTAEAEADTYHSQWD